VARERRDDGDLTGPFTDELTHASGLV